MAEQFLSSPFDSLRHLDGEREFWLARELYKVLGYNRWENFEKVIAKAKVACKYNGEVVENEFRETTKFTRHGKNVQRSIRDVELSRYACYLVVQTRKRIKKLSVS